MQSKYKHNALELSSSRGIEGLREPGFSALTLRFARREKTLRFLQEPARSLRLRALQRTERDLDAPLRFILVHFHPDKLKNAE